MDTFEIHPASLPVKIDPGGPIYAVGRVFMEDNGFRGISLLTLINPVVRLDTYSSTRNIGQVQVVHLSGKDADGDSARLAYLEFDSLQFMHTYDSIYKFRGWLTEIRVYDPSQPLPFDLGDESTRYPYLPHTKMEILNHPYPFPVSVEICYETDGTLKQWLDIIES